MTFIIDYLIYSNEVFNVFLIFNKNIKNNNKYSEFQKNDKNFRKMLKFNKFFNK